MNPVGRRAPRSDIADLDTLVKLCGAGNLRAGSRERAAFGCIVDCKVKPGMDSPVAIPMLVYFYGMPVSLP
jgi:hypothetical protein